ncbi:hypothetical protein GCM10027563_02890 [Parasphingorhabdus pacifica]
MDPNQHEDPDAKPKRLVVLAGAGVVVATGFATIAAMVLPPQQHDEAVPDLTVTPTMSASHTYTTTDAYGRPGTVSHTADRANATSSLTTRSRTGASSAAPSSDGAPPPPPKEGRPTPTDGPLPPVPPSPEPPDVPDPVPPDDSSEVPPPDGSDEPTETTTSSSETTQSQSPEGSGSQETETSKAGR